MVEETDAAVIRESQEQPAHFGVLFDRHATVLFRYLVRRVGVDDADALLGEVFRVAFEKRATYDCDRPDARPWLYGIATRLISRRRRDEVTTAGKVPWPAAWATVPATAAASRARLSGRLP